MIDVLHISPAGFGKNGVVGGAERYALELARHMADEVRTQLFCFGSRRGTETVGKLTIEHFPAQWLVRNQTQNPLSLRLFPKIIGPRIVHCHQKHILATSLSAAVRSLIRRPVFVTDLGGGGWDISAFISTQKWFTGELHLSNYSRSLSSPPHPNSHVILGGVDTEKFCPAKVDRIPRVVFVGRILPHKGVDRIIHALPEGLGLDIIGQPYDRIYLETLKDLAKDKNVRFIHGATDDDLVAAYRRSLAVLLTSVYTDCFGAQTKVPELLGQTLLEGMACGTLGIGTRVASLPEIIDHERTGFLVDADRPEDLRDRLKWLMENRKAAVSMGEAARKQVLERFTWKSVVDRCLLAYGLRRPA